MGATGELYFVEIASTGVALIDYDLDGDLDVYLMQGHLLGEGKTLEDSLFPPPVKHWPGNRLFRNEITPTGDLLFTDVTDSAGIGHDGYGTGTAVGDYDNDGDPDLYITNFGSNVLYRNDGDGRFSDVTGQANVDDDRWSTSAAFVDYDHDGDLDLYVVSYVDFKLTENKVCRSSLGQPNYCGPMSYKPVADKLFRNDGNGRFSDVTVQAGLKTAFGAGLGVVCSDLNADGWIDIYVANDGHPNQFWVNQGDGTFVDDSFMSGSAVNAMGKAEAGMGVAAGDMDNDGDDDLFMTHLIRETNTLYINDGKGNFFDTTNNTGLGHASIAYTGFGSDWFDYDNDGDLDIFVANGAVSKEKSLLGSPFPYQQKNLLFRNEGHAQFVDVSAESGPAMDLFEVSRGAAFGDIDNDGDVDIVVTNLNGPARLMLNQVGNGNNWVSVRLIGTKSNRDGYGARVILYREALPTIYRRAHTDGSYLSAGDHRVHFGLSNSENIDAIEVHWPSGLVERWQDLKTNQFLTLTEGTGTPVP